VALLIAVLGVGGYFVYPIALSFIQSIVSKSDKEQPVEPMFADETDTDMFDDEFEPVDDDEDGRNLLNPDAPAATQPQAAVSQPTVTQPAVTQPTVSQPATTNVSGNFLIIVASLPTHAEAERQVNMLQRRAQGHSFEIIDAGNNRFRISAGSFDNLAEAQRQMEQIRTLPWSPRDIWIWTARR
jgi:hypothetical protein